MLARSPWQAVQGAAPGSTDTPSKMSPFPQPAGASHLGVGTKNWAPASQGAPPGCSGIPGPTHWAFSPAKSLTWGLFSVCVNYCP